jgi:hypothetical protein
MKPGVDGTAEADVTGSTKWREYRFEGKPGNPGWRRHR